MNASFVGLAGVGTSVLIITGNIDLSIGSLLGLTSVLAAIFATHMPVTLAFISRSCSAGRSARSTGSSSGTSDVATDHHARRR